MLQLDIIHQGHVMDVLRTLPDESVDCVITSPPYYGLRNYGTEPQVWEGDKDCSHEWNSAQPRRKRTDVDVINPNALQNSNRGASHILPKTSFCSDCSAWRGELGLEPTFDLYISHLCDIFDEVRRVLKKDGTCWVNIADTYNNSSKFIYKDGAQTISNGNARQYATGKFKEKEYIFEKSLCLIPFRFCIEMVNRGWIQRNTIIWHKPSCMPQSVRDRFTNDFEYVFFFTKSKKYYFEQQFDLIKQSSIERLGRAVSNDNKWRNGADGQTSHNLSQPRPNIKNMTHSLNPHHLVAPFGHIKGRNKRCVWSLSTAKLSEAHFATFPERLIETPIKAGCPELICKSCGKVSEKIIKPTGNLIKQGGYGSKTAAHVGVSPTSSLLTKHVQEKKFIGYTDCGCGAGFRGGVVLDPFMGSGTTALVALKQNKHFVGIELNCSYIEIAKKRIKPFLEQKKMRDYSA